MRPDKLKLHSVGTDLQEKKRRSLPGLHNAPIDPRDRKRHLTEQGHPFMVFFRAMGPKWSNAQGGLATASGSATVTETTRSTCRVVVPTYLCNGNCVRHLQGSTEPPFTKQTNKKTCRNHGCLRAGIVSTNHPYTPSHTLALTLA
jgi:hypothetical protein